MTRSTDALSQAQNLDMPSVRYRSVRYGVSHIDSRYGPGGVHYIQARAPLMPYARSMGSRLLEWARLRPEHSLFARRIAMPDGSLGAWRHLSYAQALDAARRIGQSLLDQKLDTTRPVVILSENSLEHAMLALGCLYAGIPYCSVSPSYSTLGSDYPKLQRVIERLTPGLVYASCGQRYGAAIRAIIPAECQIIVDDPSTLQSQTHTVRGFDALLQAQPTSVDQAASMVEPDTIAKFTFTSGSTKLPEAVITTHRMWCANQQQLAQAIPCLTEEQLTLVDWLPWNHTFGGNHNFGIALYNGGTLYIDDGKPTPALIGETLRNLREIAPTVYFNVPSGFQTIAQQMQTDATLRRTLLSRVHLFFYAAAGLAQPIWDLLHQVQEQEIGERIVMGTGLGMTESGPFALFVNHPDVRSGDLGVPAPGLEVKLVPHEDKTEVRYRGPNITPGYWRNPAATEAAFDDEGFFCSGDAVAWIEPGNPQRGLCFDGRIAEDFKLSTGTFVSVGPLRTKIIAAGAPYIMDVVVTGLNESDVGALIFPSSSLHVLADAAPDAPMATLMQNPHIRQFMQDMLDRLDAESTGSASRIARMVIMDTPPSPEAGEITDKGSINQRAVLRNRAPQITALHQGNLPGMYRPSNSRKQESHTC